MSKVYNTIVQTAVLRVLADELGKFGTMIYNLVYSKLIPKSCHCPFPAQHIFINNLPNNKRMLNKCSNN
jgi:hypothetical protein